MNKMLEKIKEEILESTNDVELIFVYGSYALGQMQRYSDIDMAVVIQTKPHREAIFRFVEHEGQKVLLTINFHKFSDVLREIRKIDEWVWIYKAYTHAKVLFDRDQNMEKIRAELEKHKVSSKDFLKFLPENASYLLEYVGKLKNAYLKGDELNILFAARTIAKMCYRIMRPFNPVWKYLSEKETYISLITLENKPQHYVEDFKICHGLTLKSKSIDDIYTSAMRLARETTDFIKTKEIDSEIEDREFLLFFNSKEYRDFLRPELS